MCSALKTVVVFGGANAIENDAFNVAAKELGKALARRNITLVYGGGLQGTMGVVARAVHDGGGNVQGITPRFFHKDPQFIASDMIGDTIVVEDMHTRKKMFCDKADAFIGLPGGLGTLDEIIETLCWARLKLHSKPIGILNILNYYKGILDWYQNAIAIGFMDQGDDKLFEISENSEQLLDALENRLNLTST